MEKKRNLYVIPTDKPSSYVTNYMEQNMQWQHIYITSDEEIKEGDKILNPTNEIQTCIGLEKGIGTDNICWIKVKETTTLQQILNSQKIILTTDQDLDGVQAIDDEFLEWFVKNPSCEEVETVKGLMKLNDDGQEYGFPDMSKYKIIIPQEEPKKETTLEEAAEKYAKTAEGIDIPYQNGLYYGFVEGAKWQAERMYSEEDMIAIVEKSRKTGLSAEYLLLTEQFKKK